VWKKILCGVTPGAPVPKKIAGVRILHRKHTPGNNEIYQMMREQELLGQITSSSIAQPALVAAMDVWQGHAASGKTKAQLMTVKANLIATWRSRRSNLIASCMCRRLAVDFGQQAGMDFEGAVELFQRLEVDFEGRQVD
jgi:hypothetical protein